MRCFCTRVQYVLAYPCDRPVVIARVVETNGGQDEELLPIEDDEIGEIFKEAYEACAAQVMRV
jgi:hypothetical protein